MILKFTQTTKGAINSTDVVNFDKGKIYNVPNDLAISFIESCVAHEYYGEISFIKNISSIAKKDLKEEIKEELSKKKTGFKRWMPF